MSRVQFDFHMAKTQKSCLDECVGMLEKLVFGGYADTIGDLADAWQTDAALQFENKMRQQQEQMMHTVRVLKSAVSSLDEACAKMERIEGSAEEIAEKRTYK